MIKEQSLFERGQIYSMNFFGQEFSDREELKAAVIQAVQKDMPGTSKGGYAVTKSKCAYNFTPLFDDDLNGIDEFVEGVWDGLHTT
jgi:hypothetical protein